MSKGVFMPVIYRPLFDHLQMVTCRTFETPRREHHPAVHPGSGVRRGDLW